MEEGVMSSFRQAASQREDSWLQSLRGEKEVKEELSLDHSTQIFSRKQRLRRASSSSLSRRVRSNFPSSFSIVQLSSTWEGSKGSNAPKQAWKRTMKDTRKGFFKLIDSDRVQYVEQEDLSLKRKKNIESGQPVFLEFRTDSVFDRARKSFAHCVAPACLQLAERRNASVVLLDVTRDYLVWACESVIAHADLDKNLASRFNNDVHTVTSRELCISWSKVLEDGEMLDVLGRIAQLDTAAKVRVVEDSSKTPSTSVQPLLEVKISSAQEVVQLIRKVEAEEKRGVVPEIREAHDVLTLSLVDDQHLLGTASKSSDNTLARLQLVFANTQEGCQVEKLNELLDALECGKPTIPFHRSKLGLLLRDGLLDKEFLAVVGGVWCTSEQGEQQQELDGNTFGFPVRSADEAVSVLSLVTRFQQVCTGDDFVFPATPGERIRRKSLSDEMSVASALTPVRSSERRFSFSSSKGQGGEDREAMQRCPTAPAIASSTSSIAKNQPIEHISTSHLQSSEELFHLQEQQQQPSQAAQCEDFGLQQEEVKHGDSELSYPDSDPEIVFDHECTHHHTSRGVEENEFKQSQLEEQQEQESVLQELSEQLAEDIMQQSLERLSTEHQADLDSISKLEEKNKYLEENEAYLNNENATLAAYNEKLAAQVEALSAQCQSMKAENDELVNSMIAFRKAHQAQVAFLQNSARQQDSPSESSSWGDDSFGSEEEDDASWGDDVQTMQKEVYKLRNALRRAKQEIKDFHMYRDVMETTILRLQSEMQAVLKEKEQALDQVRKAEMRARKDRKSAVEQARSEKDIMEQLAKALQDTQVAQAEMENLREISSRAAAKSRRDRVELDLARKRNQTLEARTEQLEAQLHSIREEMEIKHNKDITVLHRKLQNASQLVRVLLQEEPALLELASGNLFQQSLWSDAHFNEKKTLSSHQEHAKELDKDLTAILKTLKRRPKVRGDETLPDSEKEAETLHEPNQHQHQYQHQQQPVEATEQGPNIQDFSQSQPAEGIRRSSISREAFTKSLLEGLKARRRGTRSKSMEVVSNTGSSRQNRSSSLYTKPTAVIQRSDTKPSEVPVQSSGGRKRAISSPTSKQGSDVIFMMKDGSTPTSGRRRAKSHQRVFWTQERPQWGAGPGKRLLFRGDQLDS